MNPLFHTAIYLNRKPTALVAASHGEAPSEALIEGKIWNAGYQLLERARAAQCELPLIFGYFAPLTYRAVAREIKLEEGSTTYRFADLHKIDGSYRRRDLILVRSRRPLSDKFIKSYALVKTPNFLLPKRTHKPSPKSWRDNADKAARILKDAFPTDVDRNVVVSQFVDSMREAETVCPKAWAVTLFPFGFRLNVGPVEVMTAFDGEIRLLLHGISKDVRRELVDMIQPAPYRSVPGDNFIFRGSVSQFSRHRDSILPLHREFIVLAGTTRSGRPVSGTRFREFHSPGLVAFCLSTSGQS